MPPSDRLEEIGALATMVNENLFRYSLDALCETYGLPGKDEVLLREAVEAAGFVKGRKKVNAKEHIWRLPANARMALEFAHSAASLDPNFAQGCSALGLAHSVAGQHDEAVIRARRAVELQPGDGDCHLFLALAQIFSGQAEDACQSAETALRLDPQYVNGPYLNILGFACFCAGRYEEAIAAFKRNVERGGPLAAPALMFRTASYSAAGRREEAKESAQALLNFYPAFSLNGYRMLYLFKDREVTNRLINLLRKAGLPD